MSTPSRSKFVVAVLVADRTGIIRDVASAVTDLGGNIDGVRQTVVEGYFSITLTAAFPVRRTAAGLRAAIAGRFGRGEAEVVVRPFVAVRRPAGMVRGQPYVLCLTGPDRPGILKRAATWLAGQGINVEDFEYQLDGRIVTYIGHLTVPRRRSIRPLQAELRDLMSAIGMRATLQHQNIFRATNEIGPIRGLIEEAGRAR